MAGHEVAAADRDEVQAWLDHFAQLRTEHVPDNPTAEGPQQVRIDELRRGLRLGRFASSKTLVCGKPYVDAADWSWFALRRTIAPRAEVRHPLADVLSGLSRARTAVMVLIQGDGAGVHVALPRSAGDLAAWTRSVLAPASLLDPVGRAPDLRVLSRGDVNGLRFALLAAQESRSGGKTDGMALPGLGRLLLAPGGQWSLLVHLEPVSLPDVVDLRAELVSLSSALAPHRSHTDNRDPRHSVTVEEPDVARLLGHVDTLIAHLDGAESVGAWMATAHVGAYGGAQVDMITSVAASILEEDPFSGGRWSGDRLVAEGDDPPPPTSLLSTLDIAALLAPPGESVPGLEVAVQPPGGRTRQRHRQELELGSWSGVSDEFAISVEDLEGHAFITGTTGSGKSTTAQRLLAELWNRHGIPFLVIDPVKADYEAVAPSLAGGLAVVDAADLRLNVLTPYGGFSTRTHLELLSNAFKGSFTLPSPVPYIVSQLFEQLAERADLKPTPTLHELRDMLDPFVAALGYDSEISSNIRASLGTRLSLLLSPSKAERLAAPVSIGVEQLFTRPTVVQLASLGDDEERAFLMSVLTLAVLERARSLGPAPGVRHVTVLEEAHRILPEPARGGGDPESGDASSVSARLITQMLAEIRSYGEAILVVDQSPSAVARDVVKNTNLKIAHKVLDPSDREVVGGSMGLGEERRESIAGLARGQAVILTRRLPDAQTVTVAKAQDRRDSRGVLTPQPAPHDDSRPCCAGEDPIRHHAAERRSREAEGVMALAIAGLIVDSAAEEALWEEVERGLAGIALQDPLLAAAPADAQRCLAWVGLRRGLLQMSQFGQLPREHLAKHLRAAFAAWQYRRGDSLFVRMRKRTEGSRPFYGCRYCDSVCWFRHHAAASATHGVPAAEASLRGAWDGPSQPAVATLREWQLDTAADLSSWLGREAVARGAAMCAVTQVLHRSNAPTGVQDRLLLR
ncbi:ATP-binding protein [Kineococcus sp. SYSU DK005]|uniref:ATP-binding protein n=1 Tax=Kineococcus sp. SYSU DK005 TaxID=3383126 RepID=UPI003D7D950D